MEIKNILMKIGSVFLILLVILGGLPNTFKSIRNLDVGGIVLNLVLILVFSFISHRLWTNSNYY